VSVDVQNTPDWKDYLMKKLVGATTLPVDFYLKVTFVLIDSTLCHVKRLPN